MVPFQHDGYGVTARHVPRSGAQLGPRRGAWRRAAGGLHSSTFQLNLSPLYGTRWVNHAVSVAETAQVELRSERVEAGLLSSTLRPDVSTL